MPFRVTINQLILFQSPIRRGGYTQQKPTITKDASYHVTYRPFRFDDKTGRETYACNSLCGLLKICDIRKSDYVFLTYEELVRYDVGISEVICRKCLEKLLL
jgi:hypothetical protein